jgi:hypothetical protein
MVCMGAAIVLACRPVFAGWVATLLVCCKGFFCLLWGILEVLSPCLHTMPLVSFWFFCKSDSTGFS